LKAEVLQLPLFIGILCKNVLCFQTLYPAVVRLHTGAFFAATRQKTGLSAPICLKNRHGWAAGMPLEFCKVRALWQPVYSNTTMYTSKLKNRHGWAAGMPLEVLRRGAP
jgi:hypothetical protein